MFSYLWLYNWPFIKTNVTHYFQFLVANFYHATLQYWICPFLLLWPEKLLFNYSFFILLLSLFHHFLQKFGFISDFKKLPKWWIEALRSVSCCWYSTSVKIFYFQKLFSVINCRKQYICSWLSILLVLNLQSKKILLIKLKVKLTKLKLQACNFI